MEMVVKFQYWEWAYFDKHLTKVADYQYPIRQVGKTQRLDMTVVLSDWKFSTFWAEDHIGEYLDEVEVDSFEIDYLDVRVNDLPWGELGFDKNYVLIENGGEEAYPEGKHIDEIFQVYNLGNPINKSYLHEFIRQEIAEHIKYNHDSYLETA